MQKFANQASPASRSCPQRIVFGLLSLCLGFTACGDQPASEPTAIGSCGPNARLSADIYGGLRANLDWRAESLQCESSPRPEGDGIRLRFAGVSDEGETSRKLAFILGVAALREGQTGDELATTVTLIEEGAGRFFSTQDLTNCWTDVSRQDMVPDSSPKEYDISGVLYCVAPLAELNGTASVSFADVKFSGRLSWEPLK